MSSFVKKLMATGAALSIGISSFAVADYYVNNNNCCPPPACNPCASWCDNLTFNAAWLYWKASGDDFQYAVEKHSVTTVIGANTYTDRVQKYHDLSFDLKSGFRVGLGFDVPRTCWGVNVDWTHFHPSAKDHTAVRGTSAGQTGVALPTLAFFSDTLDADEEVIFAAANKFKYDTVDIEFGKWLCCGDSSLMFRPHAGFRVADIEERFRTGFVSDDTEGGFNGWSSVAWQHKNHFKGFGVRAGLDTDFHLCEGLSLVGRGAASAIWGTTSLKTNFAFADIDTVDLNVERTKENYHNVRFITDLSFGIRYRTMACDCYPVTIELAWEHHYLFGQHRYWVDDEYNSANANDSWRSTGDVALQGLTLSFGFDF